MEVIMNQQYPLTVYFDASCRLCSSEIQAIKLHDTNGNLVLIDCSAADFDDGLFRVEGITREEMMESLHVRDSQGKWFKGVSSFELIYRTVGMPGMAGLWGGRLTRPLTEAVYPWIVSHRQSLSKLGLPILFDLWGKCSARRAYKRSRQCSDGQCSI
jgi:predicted DCC family thiol-disulfide oxidoreductase YuxK